MHTCKQKGSQAKLEFEVPYDHYRGGDIGRHVLGKLSRAAEERLESTADDAPLVVGLVETGRTSNKTQTSRSCY